MQRNTAAEDTTPCNHCATRFSIRRSVQQRGPPRDPVQQRGPLRDPLRRFVQQRGAPRDPFDAPFSSAGHRVTPFDVPFSNAGLSPPLFFFHVSQKCGVRTLCQPVLASTETDESSICGLRGQFVAVAVCSSFMERVQRRPPRDDRSARQGSRMQFPPKTGTSCCLEASGTCFRTRP